MNIINEYHYNRDSAGKTEKLTLHLNSMYIMG